LFFKIKQLPAAEEYIGEKEKTMETFKITVNYSCARGRVEENAHWPVRATEIEGEGVVQFEARYLSLCGLFHSSYAVEKIEEWDTMNPWMPAGIEHLLSLSREDSHLDGRGYVSPIVALGSIVKTSSGRMVPQFTSSAGRVYFIRLQDNYLEDGITLSYQDRLLVVRRPRSLIR
jgi:hypothetical protein